MSEEFPPELDELLETFADLEEWEERYEYLIELGRELPKIDPKFQTQEYIVHGCMSSVWLDTSMNEQRQIEIIADSDSIIVKGLIVVLLSAFSKKTPKEIVDFDVEQLFHEIGLDQHLSPNRRNGLFAMVKRIRAETVAHEASQ